MPETLRKWVKDFRMRRKDSRYARKKVAKLIFTSNSNPGLLKFLLIYLFHCFYLI